MSKLKILAVAFSFVLTFFFVLSVTHSAVIIEPSVEVPCGVYTCGNCPAGNSCGSTGTSCCCIEGCTCSCRGDQCNTGIGFDKACPSASLCCGVDCIAPHPTCSSLSANPTVILNSGSQIVTVTVTGVTNMDSDPNSIYIKAWSADGSGDRGGRDSINYYDVTDLGSGTFRISIDMTAHSGPGTIYIESWLKDSCNEWSVCSGITITRLAEYDAPTATISAFPNPAIYYLGDTAPGVNIHSNAKDAVGDLGSVALWRRKCITDACSTFGSWQLITPYFTFSPTLANPIYERSVSYTWRAGVSDLGKSNLVVNAADGLDPKYYCTGSPDCTVFPCPSGFPTQYDCDSNPDDGETDSIIVDVQAAPTASISSNLYSASPGTMLIFTSTGSDLEGDLKQFNIHKRKCTTAACTSFVPSPAGRLDGWEVPAQCTHTFTPRASNTTTCLWTPQDSEVGTWQVAVNAFDDNLPSLACSGNTDKILDGSYYPNGTWFDCGPNDSVTVTIQQTSQISGKVIDASVGGGCVSTNTTPLKTSFGTRVVWKSTNITSYTSPPISIDGSYAIDSKIFNVPLRTLYLSGNVADADQVLKPVCVVEVPENPGVSFSLFAPISGFVASPADYPIGGSSVFNLGYEYKSALNIGWMTSLDGDVYSGAGINQTVPVKPLRDFTGTLIQRVSGGGYVSANDQITIENTAGTSKICGGPAELPCGKVSGLSDSSFDIPGYDLSVPVDVDTITTLNNISSDRPHRMKTAVFNNLLAAGPVSYSVSGGGTAVVYLDGTANVRFANNFTSGGGSILLIAMRNVFVSSSVGVVNPEVGTPSNIQAFIITPGRIVIESTSDEATEKTLIVDGSLVSTGSDIKLNRDLGVSNQSPSLVVRYDPSYIYNLTNVEQGDLETVYPGLFISNIDWEDAE